jgi:hypothetical protein
MARLRPDQSLDGANAALRAAQPAVRDATEPGWNDYLTEPFTLAPAASGESQLRRRYERPLIVVLTIVALVLIIACANIANLLLARATARHHEFSVRRALGASRWRLARQLIAESAVLSVAGAVSGVAVARWGSQLLVQQISTRTDRVFLDLSLDIRVLVFTIGVTIATTLLFGVVPALRVAASEPMDAIKEHGRGVAARRVGLSGSLVVAQVALSLVLVVGATLFVRTFTALANLDLGFDRERVLVVNLNAERAQRPERVNGLGLTLESADRLLVFGRVLERVQALPAIVEAGLATITPVSGQGWNIQVDVSNAPRVGRPPGNDIPECDHAAMVCGGRHAPRRRPRVHRCRSTRCATGGDRQSGIRPTLSQRPGSDRSHRAAAADVQSQPSERVAASTAGNRWRRGRCGLPHSARAGPAHDV